MLRPEPPGPEVHAALSVVVPLRPTDRPDTDITINPDTMEVGAA